MKSNRTYLATLLLSLLFAACLVSSAQSQIIVLTLNSPTDGATSSSFICSFNYVPSAIGNTSITGATLILNGTATAATNQTAIVNNAINTIAYAFTVSGMYVWNVRIQNSTASVLADRNNTLIVDLPHPSTPTPSATPKPISVDMWSILIIVLFVLAIAAAVALVFLRKKPT
jgi:hypothetical protein